MHIGVNGRTFSVSDPGGAVQAGINFTKELDDQEDKVTVFCHKDANQTHEFSKYIGSGFIPNSQIFGLFWEQVIPPIKSKLKDVDVLFCPNSNNPFYSANIPTVVLIPDILNYLGYSTWQYQQLQRLRLPVVASTADRIVTVSEFSKKEISTELGISTDKIDVVYNGVSDRYFDDSPGDEIPVPESYLLYVGGMHGRKNIEGVVDAFTELKGEREIDTDLVMIGPKKNNVYSNVPVDWEAVKRRDDIHLPGYVTESELKYAYTHASAFIYPSRYEGFGLPPLEAMACGTPVIASNRTAIPEVLGDAALLVNPSSTVEIKDQIKRLLNQEQLYLNLVTKGRQRSELYSWERAGSELRSVLEEVALESSSWV
jgi:glycosyltransferase involved in cell wall biosynthesis